MDRPKEWRERWGRPQPEWWLPWGEMPTEGEWLDRWKARTDSFRLVLPPKDERLVRSGGYRLRSGVYDDPRELYRDLSEVVYDIEPIGHLDAWVRGMDVVGVVLLCFGWVWDDPPPIQPATCYVA